MVIEAKEELIFASQKKVSIESPNQIMMTTPLSGISMENEMHFNGMNTIIECTDETELPMVEQPKPAPPEPSYILRRPQAKVEPGIDWGGLVKYALGAVGIVIGDDPNREGTLVRQNLIFGIAGPILVVAAVYATPAIGIGIAAVAGLMAAKTAYNNEQIRQISNGDMNFMYWLNQGLASFGVLFPMGSVVTRGAVKSLACSAEMVIYVEGLGNVFGFSTMGPSICLPVIDQLNYNKAHGHK